MGKVVYRTKDEIAARKQFEQFVKPADSNAELKKEGDEWIIIANAILGSETKIVEKS